MLSGNGILSGKNNGYKDRLAKILSIVGLFLPQPQSSPTFHVDCSHNLFKDSFLNSTNTVAIRACGACKTADYRNYLVLFNT